MTDTNDATTINEIVDKVIDLHPVRHEQLDFLIANPETKLEFTKALRDVANYLAQDVEARAQFLEGADAVTLRNLFRGNADDFSPLIGDIDSTTLEGRLLEMLVAAELTEGAAGTDRAALIGEGAVLDSSSSCSGCNPGGSLLGCCIIHFWGWTSGGACTPCKTQEPEV